MVSRGWRLGGGKSANAVVQVDPGERRVSDAQQTFGEHRDIHGLLLLASQNGIARDADRARSLGQTIKNGSAAEPNHLLSPPPSVLKLRQSDAPRDDVKARRRRVQRNAREFHPLTGQFDRKMRRHYRNGYQKWCSEMPTCRDDFPKPVIDALAKRAAFICSNPECRTSTIAPSQVDDTLFIYVGKAAHICGAAKGGPRYKDAMTSDERRSASNGIFLCSFCADMIDKNGGADFPEARIREWKSAHDRWTSDNLNKRLPKETPQIDVTSIGQQGGITAGVVNLGPRNRTIADINLAALLQLLQDRSRTVRISCRMGSGEALSLGHQIREFLASNGYEDVRLSESVFGRHVKDGVEVNPRTYVISIESNH